MYLGRQTCAHSLKVSTPFPCRCTSCSRSRLTSLDIALHRFTSLYIALHRFTSLHIASHRFTSGRRARRAPPLLSRQERLRRPCLLEAHRRPYRHETSHLGRLQGNLSPPSPPCPQGQRHRPCPSAPLPPPFLLAPRPLPFLLAPRPLLFLLAPRPLPFLHEPRDPSSLQCPPLE